MKKKFFVLLILFLILIAVMNTVVFAENYMDPNQFDSYTPQIQGSSLVVVDNAINKTLGVALTILRTVAFCFALIILIYIGIKYVIATPQLKSELKKDVPTYLVGVTILFGAAGILQLVTYFINDTIG